MRTSWVLMVGVLLGGVLAGCVGSNPMDNGATGPDFTLAEGTGGIAGRVMTDEFMPIPHAQVGIAALQIVTTTDEDGAFRLAGVPPGRHAVTALALGYQSAALAVEVVAGEFREGVQITLVALVVQGPHHTTHHVRLMMDGTMLKATPDCITYSSSIKTCNGTGGCSSGAPAGCMSEVGYGHCDAHNSWGQLGCDFDHTWETIVGEVMWTPTSSLTGRGFIFEILAPNVSRDNPHSGRVNQADPRDFMHLDSQAPIRTWIDKDVLQGVKEPWPGAGTRVIEESDWCGGVAGFYVEGHCDWHWRLFPGWCTVHGLTGGAAGCAEFGPDFGVMQGQSVEVFFSYFILMHAPEGWTALPDH